MRILLDYHIKKYPKMQNQDKIKLIYQASLGPAHLINKISEKKAYKYIIKEAKIKAPIDNPYYEWISDSYIRVNILKERNLKYFSKSFYESAKNAKYDINILEDNLKKYLKENEYFNYDYKPIHHSTIYNEEYMPHYRLIHKDYLSLVMRIYQLYDYIEMQEKHTIIALEGKCASGKTTLAHQCYNASIIHADDFFLPQNLKTKARLSEIGGNINYELIKETLEKVKKAWENDEKIITIQAYDCEKEIYYSKDIELKDKVLIEGVYSYHPYFNSLIDKCAYLFVDQSTQIERIMLRDNGDRFLNEWMPLENKYFEKYKFLDNADIII